PGFARGALLRVLLVLLLLFRQLALALLEGIVRLGHLHSRRIEGAVYAPRARAGRQAAAAVQNGSTIGGTSPAGRARSRPSAFARKRAASELRSRSSGMAPSAMSTLAEPCMKVDASYSPGDPIGLDLAVEPCD